MKLFKGWNQFVSSAPAGGRWEPCAKPKERELAVVDTAFRGSKTS